jgi:hypothetical protein
MMLGLIAALAPILEKVLGAVLPDPAARANAIQQILGTLQQSDAAQNAVNTEEAKSESIFVAGWRPFIGWCCGLGLAYTYLVVPLSMYIGFVVGHPIPKPPILDNNLYELVTAMLGLGAMRSYEKVQGVATTILGKK